MEGLMYEKERKLIEYLREKLEERSMYEQLAEECMEFGKASLKMIRAFELSENKTPVSATEAFENFREEFLDVLVCLDVMGILDAEFPESAIIKKLERWAKRLGYTEEGEGEGDGKAL